MQGWDRSAGTVVGRLLAQWVEVLLHLLCRQWVGSAMQVNNAGLALGTATVESNDLQVTAQRLEFAFAFAQECVSASVAGLLQLPPVLGAMPWCSGGTGSATFCTEAGRCRGVHKKLSLRWHVCYLPISDPSQTGSRGSAMGIARHSAQLLLDRAR